MDINITVKYEQNFTLKLSQWYVQCTYGSNFKSRQFCINVSLLTAIILKTN